MRTNTMVRRLAPALLVALLVCGIAATATSGPLRATPVGTWYLATAIGPGQTLPSLVSYHVDGTLTYLDALMFGGVPEFPLKVSPFLGVWRPTGIERFGGTALGLLFDPSTNLLVGFMRARSALRFDGGRDRVVGKIYVETFMCSSPVTCPDPTDPSIQWTPFGDPVNGFPAVLTRASRVPAVPLQ